MSTTMADWMDELSPEFREKLETLRAEAVKKAYSYTKTPMASGTIAAGAYYEVGVHIDPVPVRDYPARHGTKYGSIFSAVWALMEQNYQKSYAPSKSYAMSASAPSTFSVHYGGAKYGAATKPALFVGAHTIAPAIGTALSWAPVSPKDIYSSTVLSSTQMQEVTNQVNAGVLNAQKSLHADIDQQTYFKLQTIKDYFSASNNQAS